MKNLIFLCLIALLVFSCGIKKTENPGYTIIAKWQGDKRSAVSITYDDGSINQFTVAMPIMDKLGIPGTFFINTEKIKGSSTGKFIGRPKEIIIKETASVKTNQDNFFERASLVRFTGIDKAADYHTRAGSLYESGKIREAYELMDEAFEKVRSGNLKKNSGGGNSTDTTTWDNFRDYTLKGHEFACHTITHAKLAVLDEPNLLYELEQCRADIEKNLGKRCTFSAECPYGTENERVMEYAYKIFPALRNRMPAPYLEELNRGSRKQPGLSDKEYVQWQRGPVRKITMQEMKSYADTCIAHDNIWLVLVFHGIDGIGYEPRTGAEVQEYFSYLKERDPYLWIATFGDVARYMKERKNSSVTGVMKGDSVIVNITSDLDPGIYDIPLTMKTYVPGSWKAAVVQSRSAKSAPEKTDVRKDSLGSFVYYAFKPGNGEMVITRD